MKNILLIGCGHMGSALLHSWYDNKLYKISVIDPQQHKFLKKKYSKKISVFQYLNQIKDIKKFNVIIFAIKPQIAKSVVTQCKDIIHKDVLILSIVAGKKINFFKQNLNKSYQTIRAMPNMPAFVGKGMTCLISNKLVTKKNKLIASALFKSVGDIVWLNNEIDIDKVTAISGSGPAYFFLFIEYLTYAANNLGLSKEVSKKLVYQTAFGSIDLLLKSKKSAKELKNNIAVKGGTTEAAIKIFEKNNHFRKITKNAIQAAYKKSKKLGAS